MDSRRDPPPPTPPHRFAEGGGKSAPGYASLTRGAARVANFLSNLILIHRGSAKRGAKPHALSCPLFDALNATTSGFMDVQILGNRRSHAALGAGDLRARTRVGVLRTAAGQAGHASRAGERGRRQPPSDAG